MADPSENPQSGASEAQSGASQVDEAELQRRLEEQLRKVRVQDLLLESVASILNLSARRITKEDERDLEQGRIGIEAVRALLDLLEPQARQQVSQALAQVQMLYAREARGGGGEGREGGGGGEPESGQGGSGERPKVDRPSGLWTPPGT